MTIKYFMVNQNTVKYAYSYEPNKNLETPTHEVSVDL